MIAVDEESDRSSSALANVSSVLVQSRTGKAQSILIVILIGTIFGLALNFLTIHFQMMGQFRYWLRALPLGQPMWTTLERQTTKTEIERRNMFETKQLFLLLNETVPSYPRTDQFLTATF